MCPSPNTRTHTHPLTHTSCYVNLAVFSADADRPKVAGLVGGACEALIHRFCTLDRHDLIYTQLLDKAGGFCCLFMSGAYGACSMPAHPSIRQTVHKLRPPFNRPRPPDSRGRRAGGARGGRDGAQHQDGCATAPASTPSYPPHAHHRPRRSPPPPHSRTTNRTPRRRARGGGRVRAGPVPGVHGGGLCRPALQLAGALVFVYVHASGMPNKCTGRCAIDCWPLPNSIPPPIPTTNHHSNPPGRTTSSKTGTACFATRASSPISCGPAK